MQRAGLGVGQRGEVDAGDLGTDRGRELADRQGHLQVSTLGGASSTVATLEISRQRAPIQPRSCTNSAKRENVAACSAGVGRARASSQARAWMLEVAKSA